MVILILMQIKSSFEVGFYTFDRPKHYLNVFFLYQTNCILMSNYVTDQLENWFRAKCMVWY